MTEEMKNKILALRYNLRYVKYFPYLRFIVGDKARCNMIVPEDIKKSIHDYIDSLDKTPKKSVKKDVNLEKKVDTTPIILKNEENKEEDTKEKKIYKSTKKTVKKQDVKEDKKD